jgi:hypothetical protein
MAEGQVLRDAVGISRVNDHRAAKMAVALGVFALRQVPVARVMAQNFAGPGDFEPLGHGLLRFDAFGSSHKS